MNALGNLDILAVLAREHQEEMLSEAKTRAMLKELNPRPALALILLVSVAAIALAALIVWGML